MTSFSALNTHRALIGLPPVDNVREPVFGDQPWLATDPDLGPVAGAGGPATVAIMLPHDWGPTVAAPASRSAAGFGTSG